MQAKFFFQNIWYQKNVFKHWFQNFKIVKICWKNRQKTDFLEEICPIHPKIIVFFALDQLFFNNFNKPTTGQYSVVRGATLKTNIDMFRKNWKIDIPKWFLIFKSDCAHLKKIHSVLFVNLIEQFLLRVGNFWKKIHIVPWLLKSTHI